MVTASASADDAPPTEQELARASRRAAYEARWAYIRQNSRLSLPFPTRLAVATSISTALGLTLGLSQGSKLAGLRFRAENAHRLPSTPTGWYLYHKSKNYHMALGGIKEGIRMGVKMGVWVAMFFAIEDGWDVTRGEKDFLNTVMASLTVAGGFSLWNRFPLPTAARTAKTGLAIGLAYGLAQDAVGAMRGRKLGYVEFIKRLGTRKTEENQADVT